MLDVRAGAPPSQREVDLTVIPSGASVVLSACLVFRHVYFSTKSEILLLKFLIYDGILCQPTVMEYKFVQSLCVLGLWRY